MERFLMHPLLIKIQNNRCITQCEIPHAEKYKLCKQPVLNMKPQIQNLTFLENAIETWICRRNIRPIGSSIGIIDPAKKKMYSIDMVGVKNDEIVFIMFLHTKTQIRKYQKERLLKYHQKVKDQTEYIFKVSPEIYVLNIYGDNKLWSMTV